MEGKQRKTVAEEFGKRSGTFSGYSERLHTEKSEAFSAKERLRWGRLIACGFLFLGLVALKMNLPERYEALRETMLMQAEHEVDYQAVFSAVGYAVSGEESVKDSMDQVCTAVFSPAKLKAKADSEKPAENTSELVPEQLLLDESILKPDAAPEKEKETSDKTETSQKPLPQNVSTAEHKLGFAYTVPVDGWISSPFGLREHPVKGEEKFHYGIDIAAPEGTEIVTFADGKVKAVGESTSLGKYIMVSHAEGITTLYAHCSRITAEADQKVSKGEKIAEVGSTGMATGPHLHFAVQEGKQYLDPEKYVALQKSPN